MKPLTLPLSVLLLGSSFIHADDRSIGNGTLPEFLQQFDTNNDGRIDEEERQAIREYREKLREERRNSIDTDGDGEISLEEIEAAREVIRQKIEDRRLEQFRKIAGEDDLIDRSEFSAIPGMERVPNFIFDALFARLDTDGDGQITADEFLARLRVHLQPPTRPTPELPSPDLSDWPTPELPTRPATEPPSRGTR